MASTDMLDVGCNIFGVDGKVNVLGYEMDSSYLSDPMTII